MTTHRSRAQALVTVTSALVLAMAAAGCADTDTPDDKDSQTSDITKRVGGNSGEVSLTLPAGTLGAGPFLNRVLVTMPTAMDLVRKGMLPGQTMKVAPGGYAAWFSGQDPAYAGVASGTFTLVGREIGLPVVTLAAGQQKTLDGVACVTLKAAQALTFSAPSKVRMNVGPSFGEKYEASVDLSRIADRLNSADGVRMLVPVGPVEWTTAGMLTPGRANAAAGSCASAVLKTRTFGATVEPVDPGFPDSMTASSSTEVFMKVGDAKMHPREFATRTFLAGLTVEAWAWGVKQAVGPTAKVPVRFNRLEVDDIEETMLDGTKAKRRGHFQLSKVDASGTNQLGTHLWQTHSGVDVLDGTYEVRITAVGASGTLGSIQRVAFP